MAPPRRVRTTDSRHNLPIAPNLIDRNFTTAAPNHVWLADITYIRTDEGWLYLAAVMDLYSRKIVGYARTEADARAIVSGVRIETAGGRVRASGLNADRDEHWAVSFDVQVPRTAMLTLNTRNGGISIDDFRGTAAFRAANGGITVDLHGDHWDGAGLDVETHNGGVRLTLPASYSAELETGTTNGRINIDFPVTVQGRIGRHFTTTLGAGGPKVRAITTNGGVTIRRR